ncbi:hypothetical protein [Massilia phyllosphaerae]|uniref:hypothetical protein n=1 Tax=Massilia phyllosphaerae TaxID=3106034 RepID=UPI002B1CB46B|nr:hypothetical protein [Massilia sp. SGZ-792]
MIRCHSTPNSHTAARLARLRILVGAFLNGEMTRGDMADLLQLSLSGIRPYIKDLRHIITVDRWIDPTTYSPGDPVYRLAVSAVEATAYMDTLGDAPGVLQMRPSTMDIAARDPRRHFHILSDDEHYAVRISRVGPFRHWMDTVLFGTGPAKKEAYAS